MLEIDMTTIRTDVRANWTGFDDVKKTTTAELTTIRGSMRDAEHGLTACFDDVDILKRLGTLTGNL